MADAFTRLSKQEQNAILSRLEEYMLEGLIQIESTGPEDFRLTKIPQCIFENDAAMAFLEAELKLIYAAEVERCVEAFFDERVRGTSDLGEPIGYPSSSRADPS